MEACICRRTDKKISGFTWSDLAEVISKLSDEQRKNQVYISIGDEDLLRKVGGVDKIPEDIYVNKNDDADFGSLEELKNAWGEDFNPENYRLALPKEIPFLWD